MFLQLLYTDLDGALNWGSSPVLGQQAGVDVECATPRDGQEGFR